MSEQQFERNDQIFVLLAEGHRPAQIARDLGLSRNVVAGVMARRRVRSPKGERELVERPVGRPRPPKPSKRAARPSADEALTDELAVPDQFAAILSLTDRTCHWPIGDPREEDFRYCLEVKGVEVGPYCPVHTKMAKAGSRA
jgi:GcrA cell cycle regulator